MAKKDSKSVADQIAEDKAKAQKADAAEAADKEAKGGAEEPAKNLTFVDQKPGESGDDKQLLGYLAISDVAGTPPNAGWMKSYIVMPGFDNAGPLQDVQARCAGEGNWKAYAVVLQHNGKPRLVPMSFREPVQAPAMPVGPQPEPVQAQA